MTLYVPDISHHQKGISVQALKAQGAAALIARVGQGAGRRDNGQRYATTRDREWARHRDEAKRLGVPLVAYWYVGNTLSSRENAELAKAWVGDTDLPWMIDHEDASGSIAFYRQVVTEFRRLGLGVALGYVPRWYWDSHGRGDLSGPGMPPLVNSAYPGGTGTPAQIYARAGDTSPRWAPYGGQSVAMWQFTNQAHMAGMKIDCSAFRGTTAQLAALLGSAQPEEDDLAPEDRKTLNYVRDIAIENQKRIGLARADIAALRALVVADKDIDPAELERLIDQAVAENTPSAEEVAAAQRPFLADLIRGVVPEEQADRIIQALAEQLATAATPAGTTGE